MVRSLIRPKNGLPNIATKAPTPATSARLPGACLMPTSELTFNGRVTSIGAWKTRLALMYASVKREMNPHPTLARGHASAWSAASAASS